MNIIRVVPNNGVVDLLGDPIQDGEGKPVQLSFFIKVVLRNVKVIEDLLTHGVRIAAALQAPMSFAQISLLKEDHEWLLAEVKRSSPWTSAMPAEAFNRAMGEFTEKVDGEETA